MPTDHTTSEPREPPWAKLFAWIASQGLGAMKTNLLIVLLSHADVRRPGKPVWPGERALAIGIGLRPTPSGISHVSIALKELAVRGWVDYLRAPGGRMVIGLRMLLSGASWWCESCGRYGHDLGCQMARTRQLPLPKTGQAQGEHLPKSGKSTEGALTQIGKVHLPKSGKSTEQTREQTKRQTRPAGEARTRPPAARLSVRTRRPETADGNPPRADHPHLGDPQTQEALTMAKALGCTESGFISATAQRPDLTPAQIRVSIIALSTKFPKGAGLIYPDRKLNDWISREAPAETPPPVSVTAPAQPYYQRPARAEVPEEPEDVRTDAFRSIGDLLHHRLPKDGSDKP